MTAPHRRVRILRDSASPLWFMACVEPCGVCEVCWLGSALDRERVVQMATRLGYTVEDATSGRLGVPPAAAGAAGATRIPETRGEASAGGIGAGRG